MDVSEVFCRDSCCGRLTGDSRIPPGMKTVELWRSQDEWGFQQERFARFGHPAGLYSARTPADPNIGQSGSIHVGRPSVVRLSECREWCKHGGPWSIGDQGVASLMLRLRLIGFQVLHKGSRHMRGSLFECCRIR